MVGRAGRRGFDNVGNIVFYGLPEKKIKNFISSDVSQLTGEKYRIFILVSPLKLGRDWPIPSLNLTKACFFLNNQNSSN